MKEETIFKYKELISKYKEAENFYNILKEIDKISKICLDNEGAKIDFDIIVKVSYENMSPKNIMESQLKDIEDPEEFLRKISNLENGLFNNKFKTNTIHEINLRNIDNTTFLGISEKLINYYKNKLEILNLL